MLAARFHLIQLLASSEWEDVVVVDSGDIQKLVEPVGGAPKSSALHASTEAAFGEGSWDSG